MAKAKSAKLRTLVTLRTLLKYTDENHRFNTYKLNEYLQPYGLECTRRVLGNTVKNLREMGFDVRTRGNGNGQGVWIESGVLAAHKLKQLIFAINTNPHISKSQATEILQSLKPFVTVYQEELLQDDIDAQPIIKEDNGLCQTYAVIHEAISAGKRVRYIANRAKCDPSAKTVDVVHQREMLFAPKCIYQTQDSLYVVGYNNTLCHAEAVNLKDIASVRPAFKLKDPKAAQIEDWLSDINPQQVVNECPADVIYEGPVIFHCRGRYLTELYNLVGPPSRPVDKNSRNRIIYPVDCATVTSGLLFWMSQKPDYGIRIMGPESATKAAKAYYSQLTSILLNKIPDRIKPRYGRQTT